MTSDSFPSYKEGKYLSRYYTDISAIKELLDVQIVNEYLASRNYELLAIKEKSRLTTNPTTKVPEIEIQIVYVMGLKSSSKKEETKPSQAVPNEKNMFVMAEGKQGTYQKCEPNDSLEYKNLLKNLQDHKGTLTKDGYFIWESCFLLRCLPYGKT